MNDRVGGRIPPVSNPGEESLDARLVRFRSRGSVDDAEPLARDLLAAKRSAEAAEVAEALTLARPGDFDAWALLADAHMADGDRAAAQKAWLEAARRSPSRSEPYVHIADILLDREDLDRAERIVSRGLELAGAAPALVLRRDAIAAAKRRQAPPMASEPTAVVRTSWIPGPPEAPGEERVVRVPAPLVSAPIVAPPAMPAMPAMPSEPPPEFESKGARSAPPVHAPAPKAPPLEKAPPLVGEPTAVFHPVAHPPSARSPSPPATPTRTPPIASPVGDKTPFPPLLAPSPSAPPPAPTAPTTPAPAAISLPVQAVVPVPLPPSKAPPAVARVQAESAPQASTASKPAVPEPERPVADDAFDEDGATIVRSLDDMRSELGLPSAIRPSVAPRATGSSVIPKPGPRPSAAPPPPPSKFEFPKDDSPAEDDDVESTMVARGPELAQLRQLGALLPSTPPTKHVGQPWSDASDESDDLPLPQVRASSRPTQEREDATIPYRLDTIAGLRKTALENARSSDADAVPRDLSRPSTRPTAPTPGPDATREAARTTTPNAPATSSATDAPPAAAPTAAPSPAPTPSTAPPAAVVSTTAPVPSPSPTTASPGAMAEAPPAHVTATRSEVAPPAVPKPIPSEAPVNDPGGGPSVVPEAATGARNARARMFELPRAPMVISTVALLSLGSFLAYRWDTNRRSEIRYLRLSSALLDADDAALREARDASTVLGGLQVAARRDLRLEADLIQALELGGVSVDVIRGDRVNARARDVDAGWLAAATSVEALLTQNVAGAEHALGAAPSVGTDPRLAYVYAMLSARVGRREAAERAFVALASAQPEAESVGLQLVELHRAAGDDARARAGVDAILRRSPQHARARIVSASLALDAGRLVDPTTTRAIAAGTTSAGAAEKALAESVLVRAEAASERMADATTRLARLTPPALPAPLLVLEMAAAELAVGRATEARDLLVPTFGVEPTHARARRLLGQALASLGRGDEALALLGTDGDRRLLEVRSAAALHASPEKAREVALAIAVLGDSAPVGLRARALRIRLTAGEDPAGLLALAQQLQGEDPAEREVLLALGSLAAAADRWDVLATSVSPEARAVPEFAAWLARAAMRRGALGEVETLLSTLTQSRPDAPDTAVVRAHVQAEKGQLEEALATYRELAGREGLALEGSARVVGLVGQTETLLALGRPTEARAAFDQLSLAERASSVAVIAAARLAIVEGRAAAAVSALAPRIAASGATPLLLATYADALFATDAVDQATQVYREAAQLDASLPEPQIGLAAILVRAERFAEANSQLIRARRALDARPRGPWAEGIYATLLGRTLLGRRDVEQARFVLRRAVAASSVPAEAHFFLGESLAGTNSPDARAAYARYLELAPEGAFAERAQRAIR